MENKNTKIDMNMVITKALESPVVCVNREDFLTECFKSEEVDLALVLELGPADAGYPRDQIKKKADELILKRTGTSALTSFAVGIPGGAALGLTIPADVMQYAAFSLRMAQELAYLYGAKDIWRSGNADMDEVRGKLLLYVGAMFGVGGAYSGVRLITAQDVNNLWGTVPEGVRSKAYWAPIMKQIGKEVGTQLTKTTVAGGVAKIVPIIGGVINGSITMAAMLPMGRRLSAALDTAIYEYSPAEQETDLAVLENMAVLREEDESGDSAFVKGGADGIRKGMQDVEESVNAAFAKAKEKMEAELSKVKEDPRGNFEKGMKDLSEAVNGVLGKVRSKMKEPETEEDVLYTDAEIEKEITEEEILSSIRKLGELYNDGILTEKEFTEKKADLLNRL